MKHLVFHVIHTFMPCGVGKPTDSDVSFWSPGLMKARYSEVLQQVRGLIVQPTLRAQYYYAVLRSELPPSVIRVQYKLITSIVRLSN